MNEDGIRSFISIDVEDQGILSGVERVQASLRNVGADLRIVGGLNVHVTLKFLGNLQSNMAGRVGDALDGLNFTPFRLELRGVGAFPNLNRISIVWIGIGAGAGEVEAIYNQVERSMSGLDFTRENRSFNPHITIARVRSARGKEQLAKLLTELQDNPFGSFTVDKVRLKQSILHPNGPEYRTIREVVAK